MLLSFDVDQDIAEFWSHERARTSAEARPLVMNQSLYPIFQTLMEGVAVESSSGQLLFANRALERILGYEPGELVGLHWTRLFPVHRRSWAAAGHAKGRGEGSEQCQIDLLRKDGTAVSVLANSRTLSDERFGQGLLWTFADLSGRRCAEGPLTRVEKGRPTEQQVASVAHELSNSLTILELQSQLLARKKHLEPHLGESLGIVQDQVRRMMQMVEDLRTCADPYQLCPEVTDVNAIVRRTLSLHEGQLGLDGIAVSADLAPDLPTIQADPYRLQQVFVNLIKNARQAIATVQRSGKLTISTCAVRNGNDTAVGIQVRVADNGPGIPADAMPHVFEPFFTTKQPGQGTGLGLSICEQIVRNHGGQIWAENNEVGGATFVLELPVPGQVSLESVMACGCSSLSGQIGQPRIVTGEHHILLVDDELSIVQAVEHLLKSEGFQVSIATETQQALVALEQRRIDLIICDLSMPEMAGWQFYKTLAEREPNLNRRIIFCTGDSSSQRARAFLRDSGCIWIKKPFDADELLHLVYGALASAQGTDFGNGVIA